MLTLLNNLHFSELPDNRRNERIEGSVPIAVLELGYDGRDELY